MQAHIHTLINSEQMQVLETFSTTPKVRSYMQVKTGFSSTKPSIHLMGSATSSLLKSYSFQSAYISFHMYWAKSYYFKLQLFMSILVHVVKESF